MKTIISIFFTCISLSLYAQTTPTTTNNGTFSTSPTTNGAILNSGSNSGVNPAGNPGTIINSTALSNQSNMPTPPPNTAGTNLPVNNTRLVNGSPVINTLPSNNVSVTSTTIQPPVTTPNTPAVHPRYMDKGSVRVRTTNNDKTTIVSKYPKRKSVSANTSTLSSVNTTATPPVKTKRSSPRNQNHN